MISSMVKSAVWDNNYDAVVCNISAAGIIRKQAVQLLVGM